MDFRYDYVKGQKKTVTRTQSHVKNPFKFDLEIKDKGHTEFMNVHHTSFHGDTPSAKHGNTDVKAKRSYRLDTNLHRQTHRQTDRVLLILYFVRGEYTCKYE